MNLIVVHAEFTTNTSAISDSVEDIVILGQQFLAKLDKLKSMGYESEAMNAALTANQKIVACSLANLSAASELLTNTIISFLNSIDKVNRL